jgi:hypothetical protein
MTKSTQKAVAGVAIKRARERRTNVFLLLSVILASALCGQRLFLADEHVTGGRDYLIKRKRVKMDYIEGQLGWHYFRRSYRMPPKMFKELVRMLTPLIMVGRKKKGPNGFIPPSIRVSAALRYFAGGSPYDIALTHGISHSAVFVSVWAVVDAINAHPKLQIDYPRCHTKQRKIAEGFKLKSLVGFDVCAGCIDGMLVWTEKPSEHDCMIFKCGAAKFLCGRKGKFGLNLQAICDSKRRFLECWILNPGSSSDYISYIRSPVGKDIMNNGRLAPGLALFGDNAYVNVL